VAQHSNRYETQARIGPHECLGQYSARPPKAATAHGKSRAGNLEYEPACGRAGRLTDSEPERP
jgi:hypothetical protein